MSQSNEEQSIVQVKELKNGTTECFSFELPKGSLTADHLEAYLKFLSQNKISDVMKSLLHIYFAARDDQYFEMTSMERLCFEHTLTFLADHTCENVRVIV